MASKERFLSVVSAPQPATLAEAAEVFLTDCISRNLSPNTVNTNGIALRLLGKTLGNPALADITAHDLRRFL